MNPDETLHCCDNLELLEQVADQSVDLIYIDPPFHTGRQRTHSQSQQGYADRTDGGIQGYLELLGPRLRHMHRVLTDKGTLYAHLDWRTVHYVKVFLDDLFGASNFLNEIIWHYRSGGVSKRWFGRKHDTLLVYARRKGTHTFNVQRGGTFRTDGLHRDAEGRPYKMTRNGRLYFHADGPVLSDVWDLPFLSTVALERCGYPTQKPEALLERVISASSNPQDLVADFYCGSGTTLVVAQRCGRRILGCDHNPQAIAVARRRLQSHVQPS